MPKPYNLKRTLITKDQIDRLVKTVLNNAKEDRVEAKQLLARCKQELEDPTQTAAVTNEETGVVYVDGFAKIMGATISALGAQISSNEKLVRIMEKIHKFLEKPLKDAKNPNGEMDAHLSSLVDSLKDEITDGEED
jgi:predicted transcriptional regulator